MNATTIYLLKFAAFWIFTGMIVVIILWLLYEYKLWRKKKQIQEDEYEIQYFKLKNWVCVYRINEANFKYLKDQLLQLEQMKYKNREKTKVLKDNFYWRFRAEATKHVQGSVKK